MQIIMEMIQLLLKSAPMSYNLLFQEERSTRHKQIKEHRWQICTNGLNPSLSSGQKWSVPRGIFFPNLHRRLDPLFVKRTEMVGLYKDLVCVGKVVQGFWNMWTNCQPKSMWQIQQSKSNCMYVASRDQIFSIKVWFEEYEAYRNAK